MKKNEDTLMHESEPFAFKDMSIQQLAKFAKYGLQHGLNSWATNTNRDTDPWETTFYMWDSEERKPGYEKETE